MSLLEGLQSAKKGLKATETLVTKPDGTQVLETRESSTIVQGSRTYGFVIDTKPDKIPAKIFEHLYLGSQDCTEPSILLEYNIRYVLSLGVDVDHFENGDIVYKFVPCLDLPETKLGKFLQECFAFIDCAMNEQKNILVHCNAGISRSPSVVIGYLILKCGMTYQEAFKLCQRHRTTIRPNDGFIKQLQLLTLASLESI